MSITRVILRNTWYRGEAVAYRYQGTPHQTRRSPSSSFFTTIMSRISRTSMSIYPSPTRTVWSAIPWRPGRDTNPVPCVCWPSWVRGVARNRTWHLSSPRRAWTTRSAEPCRIYLRWVGGGKMMYLGNRLWVLWFKVLVRHCSDIGIAELLVMALGWDPPLLHWSWSQTLSRLKQLCISVCLYLID